MPKIENQEAEYELEENGIFDEGDYGFIISSSGELKQLLLPDDFDIDPPAEVKKILKIFGIKDLNQSTPLDTLH